MILRTETIPSAIGKLADRHSQMNVYAPDGIAPTLDTMHEPKKVAIPIKIPPDNLDNDPSFNQRHVIHLPTGVSRTLLGNGHVGNEPKVEIPLGMIDPQGRTKKEIEPSDIAPTLRAQSHGNEPEVVMAIEDFYKSRPARVYENEAPTLRSDREGLKVAIPVSSPELGSKDQNGRRFKENGEEMFTLTARDRHGVAIRVEPLGGIYSNQTGEYQRGILENVSRYLKSENHDSCVALGIFRDTRSEYGEEIRKDYEAGNLDISQHEFLEKEIREDETSNTLTSVQKDNLLAVQVAEGEEGKEHPGIYVELYPDCAVYAVWYEKYQCYVAIRKLLPLECFRLQSFSDEDFEKAAFVNSDSQLYKQAGNSICCNIAYVIGKKIAEITQEKEKNNV